MGVKNQAWLTGGETFPRLGNWSTKESNLTIYPNIGTKM